MSTVFTKYSPTVDDTKSKECRARGKNMNDMLCAVSRCAVLDRVAPRIIAEIIYAVIDSNKSAACPAQSPTLSPTKSATTAGLR